MQAVVEGVGVPVAIGATGVLLLVLDALDLGVGAVIVFGLLLSVAVDRRRRRRATGSYVRALADAMRRRPLTADLTCSTTTCRRSGRCSGPTTRATCGSVWICSRASPRRRRRPSSAGSPSTRTRRCACARWCSSPRAATRERPPTPGRSRRALAATPAPPRTGARAAAALAGRGSADGPGGARSRCSTTPSRRCAPRRSMRSRPPTPPTRRSSAASSRPSRSRGPRAGPRRRSRASATRRLRSLAAALAREGARRRLRARARRGDGRAPEHGVGIVAPALDDPDRSVVLAALDALDAAGGRGLVAPEVLDGVFRDAAALAARALAARGTLADHDGPLDPGARRRDRSRAPAGDRGARAPPRRSRSGPPCASWSTGRALAARSRSRPSTSSSRAPRPPSRFRSCAATCPRRSGGRARRAGPPARSREEWIADIADDPEGVWRSSWLAACARHAVGSVSA